MEDEDNCHLFIKSSVSLSKFPFFIWLFIPLPFSLSVFISSLISLFERSEKKGKQRISILYLAIYTATFLSLCFSFFSDLSKVFERSEKKGKQRVPIIYLAIYTAAFLSLCFSFFSDLSKSDIREESMLGIHKYHTRNRK